MKDLLKNSIERAITFEEYFNAIEKSMNGAPIYNNDKLDYYTQLNYRRMKRLNKAVKLDEELVKAGKKIPCDLIWLVLTEGWCGDAAQILPVLNKIAESVDQIDLKLVYRDQNIELMDKFLTNGGRSIPKVIIIDKNSPSIKGSWGPRPKPAQDMFLVYKNSKPKKEYEEFQVELQKWYTKDKAEHIQREILPLLDLCHK